MPLSVSGCQGPLGEAKGGRDMNLEAAEWNVSMGMLKSPMLMVGLSVKGLKCRSQMVKWSITLMAGPGGRVDDGWLEGE